MFLQSVTEIQFNFKNTFKFLKSSFILISFWSMGKCSGGAIVNWCCLFRVQRGNICEHLKVWALQAGRSSLRTFLRTFPSEILTRAQRICNIVVKNCQQSKCLPLRKKWNCAVKILWIIICQLHEMKQIYMCWQWKNIKKC